MFSRLEVHVTLPLHDHLLLMARDQRVQVNRSVVVNLHFYIQIICKGLLGKVVQILVNESESLI